MWKKIFGLGLVVVFASIAIVILSEVIRNGNRVTLKSRQETLPTDIAKVTPEMDYFPPILQSDDWYAPIPLPGPIDTVGAEDSPFLTPDGQWFFYFFTPDVRVPAEKQLIDGVTGIWWSKKVGANWTEPERVVLSDDVSLDGAEFVQDNTMWFGSVRTGNYREIDIYVAKYDDGQWTDVINAGEQLNVQYDIGEFCLSPDGKTLYFGCIVFCHPTEIISRFAGEPTLDGQGNIYFVHHFYSQNGTMIEADIYVAYRKAPSGN